MNCAKHGWKVFSKNRIRILALAVLISLIPATMLLAQTPTLRDTLQNDADGNSKTNAGDRLRYTLTFTNTSGVTLTNVLISVPAITDTTLDGAATSASPLARDEGPIAASVPGNAFHTAFNTPLIVNAGESLLNNDFPGAPAAAITTFGGGTLGGTVDDNNAGATANSGGHSLTVNPDGTLTYTPATGFAGLFMFQYRLANASGSDTATVTIAVGERPGPVADARAVTGNVQIDTATGTPFSVLSNDDGDAVTINLNTAGTLGAVNMNANGQFVYTPPRGKVSGTDTFSYTLSNGFGTSGPATVTLNFDGNIVWFVDSSASAGDGRSHLPYNSLSAFNAVNDGGANNPADNHVIVLRDGTYANNVAGGALVLSNGQRVIGDGWSGTFNAAAGFSVAEHSVGANGFSGTDPLIQNSTGHGIALAANNQLRGVTVGNTPSGFGYSGGAVGALTLSESSKTGTGGAISVTTSGTFGSSVNFDTLESSSSISHNLSLTNVAGTLGVTSGGAGLAGSAANFSAVNINGGSVSLTYPGTVSKANAGSLVNVSGGHTTGALTFNNTMSATSGDGLQFNNADGIYNFTATVTLNGGDAGVDIINGSSGNFSFSDTDISNPSGAAFLVSTSAGGSIGHAGTITKNNAGRAVDIQGKTGGSVTFNGAISQNNAASTGIFLNGNTGGTINFLDAITLTTSVNAAFTATGGGTVTATAGGNTLTTTTGIALNVANTTIGAAGLTFQTISANGASSGIVLNNTGTIGLTVTGTGTPGSGGTIQNTTGDGISLTTTRSLSLTSLNVSGAANHGINANGVVGLTLTGCQITNCGNGDNEHDLNLVNVSGTVLLDSTTFNGASEDLVHLENNNLNVTFIAQNGCHFTYPASIGGFANSAMLLLPGGNSSISATVRDCLFTNVRGVAFQIGANTLNANGTQSAFISNNVMNVTLAGRASGVFIGGQELTTTTMTIVSNRFTGAGGNGVISVDVNDSSRVTGVILGNSITNSPGIGMFLAVDEAGKLDAVLGNNRMVNSGGDGIQTVNFGGAGISDMRLAITNNTVNNHSTNPAVAFVGGISVTSFEDNTCVALRGNTITGTSSLPSTRCGGAPCVDYYVEEVGGTARIEEIPDTAKTTADAAYIQSLNSPPGAAVTIFGFLDLTNGGQCPAP
jgi:hypothetical protein